MAYDGGEPVGWAAVHPRADTSFARNRKIPHIDDQDAWSVWCLRVRPGHRGMGISHHLLKGAVNMARSYRATAIEGYPVDNGGSKVDLTMAYVGTRRLFEDAGFTKAARHGAAGILQPEVRITSGASTFSSRVPWPTAPGAAHPWS